MTPDVISPSYLLYKPKKGVIGYMQKIQDVIKKVRESAKQNSREVRFIDQIEVGQVVRQGDIYIHTVAQDHIRSGRLQTRQLAEGLSQGARHVAEPPAEVYEWNRLPEWCTGIAGPVVVSAERFTVSHPEHADISLPAGTYMVTYQMDPRTMERVRD